MYPLHRVRFIHPAFLTSNNSTCADCTGSPKRADQTRTDRLDRADRFYKDVHGLFLSVNAHNNLADYSCVGCLSNEVPIQWVLGLFSFINNLHMLTFYPTSSMCQFSRMSRFLWISLNVSHRIFASDLQENPTPSSKVQQNRTTLLGFH